MPVETNQASKPTNKQTSKHTDCLFGFYNLSDAFVFAWFHLLMLHTLLFATRVPPIFLDCSTSLLRCSHLLAAYLFVCFAWFDLLALILLPVYQQFVLDGFTLCLESTTSLPPICLDDSTCCLGCFHVFATNYCTGSSSLFRRSLLFTAYWFGWFDLFLGLSGRDEALTLGMAGVMTQMAKLIASLQDDLARLQERGAEWLGFGQWLHRL